MQRSTNETNNLSTVTTSFLVVLNSQNGTMNNGTNNSDVTFMFESPIVKPDNCFLMSVCAQQFSSPNSLYNINETNNYLNIGEYISGIWYYYDINFPFGNYNVNTFQTQLISLLSTYSNKFTISYNSINNKLTINNSAYQFVIVGTSTISYIMGMISGANQASQGSTTNTLQCPYQANFNGMDSIHVMIENMQTPNIDSFHKTNAHVIQSITIDPTMPKIIYEKSNDYCFKVNENVFDHLRIQICDGTNTLVNFNNQNWNLTLLFSIIYDVNRFDHELTFDSILKYGYY